MSVNKGGELSPGEVIEGKYTVDSVLGKGGMGKVYRVTHITLGKIFALKMMDADVIEPNLLLRFKREAKALALINHPNIVMIVDYGVTPQNSPYIVMEHISGETLRARLEKGLLSEEEAIQIAKQVCSGLHAAHLQGIIHRDLKPENIVLQPLPDGELMARVLDFGIAKSNKWMDDSLSGNVTGDNAAGTLKYMSLEQINNDPVDERTDVFALSCIIYEMLTGVVPSCLKARVEPLHVLRPDVNMNLSAVVLKGTSRLPESRHANMLELKADLDNIVRDVLADSIGRLNQSGMEANANSNALKYRNFITGNIDKNDTNSFKNDTLDNINSNTTEMIVSAAVKPSSAVTRVDRVETSPLFVSSDARRRGVPTGLIIGLIVLLLAGAGFFAYRPLQKALFPENEAKEKLPETAIPVLVGIKGGKLIMGTNVGDVAAQPEHPVEVADFGVSRFLVTNNQYAEFVKRANHRPPASWQGSIPPALALEKPVTDVSWEDATAYCNWLTTMTGQAYNLPTEEQWEFLARNNGKFNVSEIMGEVLEWTDTKFYLYPGSKMSLPDWVSQGNVRIFRGKNSESIKDPVTFRFFQFEKYSFNNIGFRIGQKNYVPKAE